MHSEDTQFDFHGHRVSIQVEPGGGGWYWSYSIDHGASYRSTDASCYCAHVALEEAGIEARDRIRAMLDPEWCHNTGVRSAMAALRRWPATEPDLLLA